jgi:hypothetical protein
MDFPTARNLAFERRWPFEDREPDVAEGAAAKKSRAKPKCKRLPNAVLDDCRLSLAETFLLSWRARQKAGWNSQPAQLAKKHGFRPDLFHPSMRKAQRAWLHHAHTNAPSQNRRVGVRQRKAQPESRTGKRAPGVFALAGRHRWQALAASCNARLSAVAHVHTRAFEVQKAYE